MTKEWQRLRQSLNHDWLKASYLRALGKYIHILEDKVEDSLHEWQFPTFIFREWEDRHEEVRRLLEEFEDAMTPRTLFFTPPLENCSRSTLEWLPGLVHELWLSRNRVFELLNKAWVAFEETDQSYCRATRVLSCAGASPNLEDLRGEADVFRALRRSCMGLFEAIQSFPNRVQAI